MKISKQSWHYKLLTNKMFFGLFNKWTPFNSLCLYFWQVVGRIVIPFFSLLFMLAPIVSVPIVLFDLNPDLPIILNFVIVFGIGASFCYIVGLGMTVFALVGWALETLWGKIVPNTSDSLVTSYVKAKKDRVCPVLEFHNDN